MFPPCYAQASGSDIRCGPQSPGHDAPVDATEGKARSAGCGAQWRPGRCEQRFRASSIADINVIFECRFPGDTRGRGRDPVRTESQAGYPAGLPRFGPVAGAFASGYRPVPRGVPISRPAEFSVPVSALLWCTGLPRPRRPAPRPAETARMPPTPQRAGSRGESTGISFDIKGYNRQIIIS